MSVRGLSSRLAARAVTFGTIASLGVLIACSALEASTPDAAADDDVAPKAAAPNGDSSVNRSQESTPLKATGDAGVVELDRDAQEKGGIETRKPTATIFQETARGYATVLPLDRAVALYNSALTNAAQLKAAQAKQEESRAAADRATTLLRTFASAKAQAESAAATADIDTAGVAVSKAQIEALRNTALLEWGPTLGAAIVDRTPLATDLVAGRSRLVQLSLNSDAAVTPPQRLSLSRGDAVHVEGRFISEAAQADPKVQSGSYLYAIPAAAALLPGISVLADLPVGSPEPGFEIPSSAVVWLLGKPWFYLRTAADRFERRPVGDAAAVGADGGYLVPAARLGSGDRLAIVITGAQVLLSQEMHTQIPSDGDDN